MCEREFNRQPPGVGLMDRSEGVFRVLRATVVVAGDGNRNKHR
jgi:hypothetical protein